MITCFYLDYKEECERMVKTFNHFHPEKEIMILNREEVEGLVKGFKFWYPTIGIHFMRQGCDSFTHIDADVLVVDRIDDLFDTSFDVLAGRNNSDNNYAGRDRGFTLPGLDPMKYVNAGIHTINSFKFMLEWHKISEERGEQVPFGEQGTLNELFNSGRYTAKILDPVEKNELWGSSFIEGTVGMHDLWKEIRVENNSLFLGNKKIKMMHIAGGGRKPPLKDLLSSEVCSWLGDVLHVE